MSSEAQAALDWSENDARTVDLIRVLAMDAVERAGSGHPGTAMSLAPAAYLLYQKILRHDPADPLILRGPFDLPPAPAHSPALAHSPECILQPPESQQAESCIHASCCEPSFILQVAGVL